MNVTNNFPGDLNFMVMKKHLAPASAITHELMKSPFFENVLVMVENFLNFVEQQLNILNQAFCTLLHSAAEKKTQIVRNQ